MARKRYIKPDFFKDEKLAELPFEYRLFLEGLWCWADREGRLEDRPKYLKSEIFPYDDFDSVKCIDRLQAAGFVERYSVGGVSFIQINHFATQQNVHPDEKRSNIPPPTKNLVCGSENLVGGGEILGDGNEIQLNFTLDSNLDSNLDLDSKTFVEFQNEKPEGEDNPVLLEQETAQAGCEAQKTEAEPIGEVLKPPNRDVEAEIFAYWQKYLRHPNSKLDKTRRRAIAARLKEGYTVERIKAAIRGISFSPHHMGKNDRNTVYDDIELICRSGKNIDRFADLEESHAKNWEPNQVAAKDTTTARSGLDLIRALRTEARASGGGVFRRDGSFSPEDSGVPKEIGFSGGAGVDVAQNANGLHATIRPLRAAICDSGDEVLQGQQGNFSEHEYCGLSPGIWALN